MKFLPSSPSLCILYHRYYELVDSQVYKLHYFNELLLKYPANFDAIPQKFKILYDICNIHWQNILNMEVNDGIDDDDDSAAVYHPASKGHDSSKKILNKKKKKKKKNIAIKADIAMKLCFTILEQIDHQIYIDQISNPIPSINLYHQINAI